MAETHPSPSEEQGDAVELAGLGRHARDQIADERDRTSEAFDKASDARDARADARDDRAEIREEARAGFDAGAASDRAGAKRDRQGGAHDRKRAGRDREDASTDRDLSARERAVFLVDELTGAHRRDAGILELEREITRAQRTEHPFVLVFVDVDGLKTTNDSLGHAAGDELLRHVIDTIRAHVRPYDLIVRYGVTSSSADSPNSPLLKQPTGSNSSMSTSQPADKHPSPPGWQSSAQTTVSRT